MRILQPAAVSLLATMTIAACKDGPTTSTARTPAVAPPAMGMVHSSTAGGFSVQVLSRSSFLDNIDATFRIKLSDATKVVQVDDPSEVVVAKVTIQPGGSLGWHTHPGPAIASVASGELSIINASDCATRRYAAGKAFIDPGQGNIHVGYNDSSSETVVYVTFLDVPPGQPATIPAQDPGCQAAGARSPR